MKRLLKILFDIRVLVFLLVIGILHFLGVLWLYDNAEWIDIPLHFLGGAWVAFIAALWFFAKNRKQVNLKHAIFIVVTVIVVGILWELSEVSLDYRMFGGKFTQPYFSGTPGDTALDLIMDIIGAVFIVFIFWKKQYKAT